MANSNVAAVLSVFLQLNRFSNAMSHSTKWGLPKCDTKKTNGHRRGAHTRYFVDRLQELCDISFRLLDRRCIRSLALNFLLVSKVGS